MRLWARVTPRQTRSPPNEEGRCRPSRVLNTCAGRPCERNRRALANTAHGLLSIRAHAPTHSRNRPSPWLPAARARVVCVSEGRRERRRLLPDVLSQFREGIAELRHAADQFSHSHGELFSELVWALRLRITSQ